MFLELLNSEIVVGILQYLSKLNLNKVKQTCKLLHTYSSEAHQAQETLKNRILPAWSYTVCKLWNNNSVLEAFGEDEAILIDKTIVLQDREHFLINQGKIVYLSDLIYLTKTGSHCIIDKDTLYAIDQVICTVDLLNNTWKEKMDMPYSLDLDYKNIVCFHDTLVMFNPQAVFIEKDGRIQWARNIPYKFGNEADYIRVFTNEHGIFMCRFDQRTHTFTKLLKYNFYDERFILISTTGPSPIINDSFFIVSVNKQTLFIPEDLSLGMWACVTTRIHSVIHALWVHIPVPLDVIGMTTEKCVYVCEHSVDFVMRDVGCWTLICGAN